MHPPISCLPITIRTLDNSAASFLIRGILSGGVGVRHPPNVFTPLGKSAIFSYDSVNSAIFSYHSVNSAIFSYHSVNSAIFSYHSVNSAIFSYHSVNSAIFSYHSVTSATVLHQAAAFSV